MASSVTHPIVRGATAADHGFLVDCNVAMALETEHLHLPRERVASGVSAILADAALGRYALVEVDGAPVGTLMLTWEWSDWRNGLFWWIQSVYILPDARRQGHFRRLYQAVRAEAAADPRCCGLRLYVERENLAAQRTYSALGMHETPYRIFEEEFAR